MCKKVLLVAIVLSMILLLADYSLCSDDSYDAGYRLGRGNGQIDRESGHPSDPYATASSYEWVAKSNNYNLASFRNGFIDGYKAGYGYPSRARGRNYFAIALPIIAIIVLLFVFKIYPAIKKKESYKRVQSSIESADREMDEEIRYGFLAYIIRFLQESFRGYNDAYDLTGNYSLINIVFLLKEGFRVPVPYHYFEKEGDYPSDRSFRRISECVMEADLHRMRDAELIHSEYDNIHYDLRTQPLDKASAYIARAEQFIQQYSSKLEDLISFLFSLGEPSEARWILEDSAKLYFIYVNKLNRILSAKETDKLIKEANCLNTLLGKKHLDLLVKKGLIKLAE